MDIRPRPTALADSIHKGRYTEVTAATYCPGLYSGTMAAAYIAMPHAATVGQQVVVKVWKDPIDKDSFHTEVTALAKLGAMAPSLFIKAYLAEVWLAAGDGSPHGSSQGSPLSVQFALTMERAYASAFALKPLVADDRRDAFTRRCMTGISQALVAVNAAGYIYGDLKPDNILLVADSYDGLSTVEALARYLAGDAEMRCVLADFDTSQVLGRADNRYIGTKYYRAPELIMHLPFGPPADVWSFAVVAYELLTGARLFGEHDLISDESSGGLDESGSGLARSHSGSSGASSSPREVSSSADDTTDILKQAHQLWELERVLGPTPAGCLVRKNLFETPSCATCGTYSGGRLTLTAPSMCVVREADAPDPYLGRGDPILEDTPGIDPLEGQSRGAEDGINWPAPIDAWWADVFAGCLRYEPKKRESLGAISATMGGG